MSDNLTEAVALLNDLLELGRTTTSAVDQAELDAIVTELLPAALKDVGRLAVQLAADTRAAEEAATEAEAEAERARIEEEDRAAQALVQEEEDRAEREERHRAGVS